MTAPYEVSPEEIEHLRLENARLRQELADHEEAWAVVRKSYTHTFPGRSWTAASPHQCCVMLLEKLTCDLERTTPAPVASSACLMPTASQCALLWESNHQGRVLQEHGLFDEYGHFGCDAIDWLAGDTVRLREKCAVLETRVSELSQALVPFSDQGRIIDTAGEGEGLTDDTFFRLVGSIAYISVGDCRRAAATLHSKTRQ